MTAAQRRPLAVRLLVGFGRFWWDFLVGDTPELFVATLVVVGGTASLSHAARANAAAVVLLPLAVVVALGLSVARAIARARR